MNFEIRLQSVSVSYNSWKSLHSFWSRNSLVKAGIVSNWNWINDQQLYDADADDDELRKPLTDTVAVSGLAPPRSSVFRSLPRVAWRMVWKFVIIWWQHLTVNLKIFLTFRHPNKFPSISRKNFVSTLNSNLWSPNSTSYKFMVVGISTKVMPSYCSIPPAMRLDLLCTRHSGSS